jgi:solute carrier family 25 carnitine/acylcarnitine transporter 20/29
MDFKEFFVKLQEELIYGSIAGLGICMVGHPFDTIKTRKQVMGGSYIKMITNIFIKESPFAFYKGLASPLFTMPLINSIVFSSYSLALSQLNKLSYFKDHSQDSKIILASVFAGFLNAFVAGPTELFKTKLQIQKDGVKLYKGNIDLFRKLFRVSGFKGIFQGLYLTIMRDSISYGAQFYTYHKLVHYFMNQRGIQDEG